MVEQQHEQSSQMLAHFTGARYKSQMPNQRAKNKTYLGGFVEKRLLAKLDRLAKEAGMEDNRFGFATLLLQEALESRVGQGKSRSRKHASPKV